MNIFYLDDDPLVCAKMHCDKHVVKMILEYAQILSTAWHETRGKRATPIEGLYKATHTNHPSAVWARASIDHYEWLARMWGYLLDEYTERYKKDHKTGGLHWKLMNAPPRLIVDGWKPPPQCMPNMYKAECTVSAYRSYYNGDKAAFATWKYSPTPIWWNPNNASIKTTATRSA